MKLYSIFLLRISFNTRLFNQFVDWKREALEELFKLYIAHVQLIVQYIQVKSALVTNLVIIGCGF